MFGIENRTWQRLKQIGGKRHDAGTSSSKGIIKFWANFVIGQVDQIFNNYKITKNTFKITCNREDR